MSDVPLHISVRIGRGGQTRVDVVGGSVAEVADAIEGLRDRGIAAKRYDPEEVAVGQLDEEDVAGHVDEN